MTDQEFDELLCRVMIDAAKADIEEIEAENIPVSSSRHFQREMRKMLKDPLRWAKAKTRPMWKTVLQKVAVFFIVCSLSLGSIIAFSPTVRAAVIRWVTEWYETYIVYSFQGEAQTEKISEYTIKTLPDGYVEDKEQRIETPTYIRIVYYDPDDNNAEYIYLKYFDMQESFAVGFDTSEAEVIPVDIDGNKGQLYKPYDVNCPSTIAWIDIEKNLQFVIDAVVDNDVILHMANSVSLSISTN